jgi:plastocyanin
MSDETPDQELEPAEPTDESATEAGAAVAVAERPGAVELAAREERVELRKDRLWLPFLIPVGAILAVALFAINISRVFLAASQDSSDPAVIAAIILTLAVLFGATFIAAVPKLRTSSLVLTMAGVTAIVLLSGSLTLGASEDKEVESAEPTGPADNTLQVDGSNFRFQSDAFKAPAGVLQINYASLEGSHTLAFDEPQFAYVNLAVPGGKDSTKIEAVEGQTYTFYCTLPGHRAAGMHATLTIGPKGGTPEAGTETPTTTLPGATTTTAPSGRSEVDSSSQSGDQLGN